MQSQKYLPGFINFFPIFVSLLFSWVKLWAKIYSAKNLVFLQYNISQFFSSSGDLGPVYGFEWCHFGAEYVYMYSDYSGQGVDQLAQVIHTIKTNHNDRRIIMSACNPVGKGSSRVLVFRNCSQNLEQPQILDLEQLV